MATQELIPPLTRVQYVGDGKQTSFSLPFQFIDKSDVEVYLEETQFTMGFQIQNGGSATGGSVTFSQPPSLGVLITFVRKTSTESPTHFQESGTLRAKALNAAFDHAAAVDQDARREFLRTVRLHPTDDDADLVLPHKDQRSGKTLAFDAEGNVKAVTIEAAESHGNSTLDDIPAGTANVHFTTESAQKLNAIKAGAEPNPALVTDSEKTSASEVSPRTFSPKDVADIAATHGGTNSTNFGSAAGTVCEGNDDRLSDDRNPLPHTHQPADITNLSTVAVSGSYSDLTGRPTVPVSSDDLVNSSKVAGLTVSDAIDAAAAFGAAGDAHASIKNGNPHNTSAAQIGAEPAFAKKTAFNRDFGGSGTAVTIARSDHHHPGDYEPLISKKSGFNKEFGSTSGTVCEGDDPRLSDARVARKHGHGPGDLLGVNASDIGNNSTVTGATVADALNTVAANNAEPGNGLPEAPQDGELYARSNGSWRAVPSAASRASTFPPLWGQNKGPYVGYVIRGDQDGDRECTRETWALLECNTIGMGSRGKARQGAYRKPTAQNPRGSWDWGSGGSGDIPARLAYEQYTPGLFWTWHGLAWYSSISQHMPWTPETWELYTDDQVAAFHAQFSPYYYHPDGTLKLLRIDVCNEPISPGASDREKLYMNPHSRREAEGGNTIYAEFSYWQMADPVSHPTTTWTEGPENWPRSFFRACQAHGVPKEACYYNQFGCVTIHYPFGTYDEGIGANVTVPPEFGAVHATSGPEVKSNYDMQLWDGYIELAERTIENGGDGQGYLGGIGFQHHCDPDWAFCYQIFEWQMAECLRLGLQVAVTEASNGMSSQASFGIPDQSAECAVLAAQYMYKIYEAYFTYSNVKEITVWQGTQSAGNIVDIFPLTAANRVTWHAASLAKAAWEAKPVDQRTLKARKVWLFCYREIPLRVTATGTGSVRDSSRGGWQSQGGGYRLGGWPFRRLGINGAYEPFPSEKWCFEGMVYRRGGNIGDFLVVEDADGNLVCKLNLTGTTLTLTAHTAGGERTRTLAVLQANANWGYRPFVLAYDNGVFAFTMKANDNAAEEPATLTAVLDRTPAEIYYGGGNGVGTTNVTVYPLCLYPSEDAPAATDAKEIKALCTVKHSKYLTYDAIRQVNLAGWHPKAEIFGTLGIIPYS